MPLDLDGKLWDRLSKAILAGFARHELDRILRINNWRAHNVADGDDYEERVGSLIDVSYREGWLVALCEALADARKGRAEIYVEFIQVRDTLLAVVDPRNLTVIFSSVEIDSTWKRLNDNGDAFAPLKPYIAIDTLMRRKQSKDSISGIMREIDDARLFVAFVSKHYRSIGEGIGEFDRAFARLVPGSAGEVPSRRVLALIRDQESRDWITQRQNALDRRCHECLIVADLSDIKNRNDAPADGPLAGIGKALRDYFDGVGVGPGPDPPPPPPPPDPAPAPGAVIVLGEPRVVPVPKGIVAADELTRELKDRDVPHERWPDGWRTAGKRPVTILATRPVFVRTILDEAPSNAADIDGQLTSQLKSTFGFEFDDESESVRPLLNCPKVLWRPNGPEWKPPQAGGPTLYVSAEQPPEFARWLAKLLRINDSSGAVVYYEDPAAKGDLDNSVRRTAIEHVLASAMTSDMPPLHPDTAPFGYDQLIDVIKSVDQNSPTVIAAHDMRTTPGSRQATIERFREIDRVIDQTLATKRAENAPLVRVAVLFRNPELFPWLQFSRDTRVANWHLLRMFKNKDRGTYVPDPANVERLREAAEVLARRQPEQRAA
jgi:hypothetical protein